MSEKKASKPAGGPPTYAAEAQKRRWVKYGSNVTLAVVLVVVLAGVLTYIAQARDWRLDTTAQGVNSLHPQTLHVLHNLNEDVKLISLYSPADNKNAEAGDHPLDKARFVSDLLDSYKRHSGRISTEVVDPTDQPSVDALKTELEQRYGKGIGQYKSFLDEYAKSYQQLLGMTGGEVARAQGLRQQLQNVELKATELTQNLSAALNTPERMERELRLSKESLDRALKDKHPDYKEITGNLRDTLDAISGLAGQVAELFEKHKSDADLPKPVGEYLAASLPGFKQIQAQAKAQVSRIEKLGELKVEDLVHALDVRDPILVLGPDSWKILPESQVWPVNNSVKAFSDGKVRPDFAGEQQITTAIYSLTTPHKPKVVFLRAGGPPLTDPQFSGIYRGTSLVDLGTVLRQYNFDVLEKDYTGQWQQQAMQFGGMPTPEPDWKDLNDAVWVLLDNGATPPNAPPVAMQLAAHLGHGGSAMVLMSYQADKLDAALSPWGVEAFPDTVIVHQQTPAPQATPLSDIFQNFLRQAPVFDLHDYGDAAFVKPLNTLPSFMVPLIPIKTREVKGYTATPLLPIPDAPAAPKSWGETNVDSLRDGGAPQFHTGDMTGPLFAGAAVEKDKGGRLVVIGSSQFATDLYAGVPDPEIARNEGRLVPRFPGNEQLAVNSLFWLARMDSMIAITPSALQVSRIASMSGPLLSFWRIGVLLVLLPGVVIVGGVGMFFARRD